jgi:general secretion pathway protein H
VAVIGFLFTITAVSIRNFIIPSSSDTSETIESSLKYAYNHALLNHKTVIFQLDFGTQEYQVFRIDREDDGIKEVSITKLVKLPFNNQIFAAIDIGGRKQTEEILRISYGHDGTGEDYTLLMGDEGNIKKSIQVFRYGGKVRRFEGEKIRVVANKLENIDYGVDERSDEDRSNMNRY